MKDSDAVQQTLETCSYVYAR